MEWLCRNEYGLQENLSRNVAGAGWWCRWLQRDAHRLRCSWMYASGANATLVYLLPEMAGRPWLRLFHNLKISDLFEGMLMFQY